MCSGSSSSSNSLVSLVVGASLTYPGSGSPWLESRAQVRRELVQSTLLQRPQGDAVSQLRGVVVFKGPPLTGRSRRTLLHQQPLLALRYRQALAAALVPDLLRLQRFHFKLADLTFF